MSATFPAAAEKTVSGAVGAGAAQWTSDSVVPPDGIAWDLLIVGGGTAGIVAAKTAAGFGVSVLLVERARTGGDCFWTGCVPSKALLAAAHTAADARTASLYGVHVSGVRVDFAEVMSHVRAAIAAIEPGDSPATLQAAGVRVAHGTARFTGPDTALIEPAQPVVADGPEVPQASSSPRAQTVRFRQALLATGSAPAMPPIPGLADVGR